MTEGRVEVLGAGPGERTDKVGYLPQRRAFDPSVRVRGVDVVRLGWDGHPPGACRCRGDGPGRPRGGSTR